MRSKVITIILIVVNAGLCYGQDAEKLSNFIYSLPIMEGMEIQGSPEEVKYKISDSIEIAIITKVLQSKDGRDISAEDINKFYNDHFESLEFRVRQDTSGLSGTYNAPSVVTNGSAHIWSQGRIKYWIPKEGNSVTFFLYQRREFDMRQSQPLLDKIKAAFEAAAGEFKYKFTVLPDYTMVSDWPVYLENECFVGRIFINIGYEEVVRTGRPDMGDDKSFRFYCSVFPTSGLARQWRDKIIEEHDKIQRWPDWFVEGVGMSPAVVDNIVVEYKGQGQDKDDSEFGKKLIEELNKIEKTN